MSRVACPILNHQPVESLSPQQLCCRRSVITRSTCPSQSICDSTLRTSDSPSTPCRVIEGGTRPLLSPLGLCLCAETCPCWAMLRTVKKRSRVRRFLVKIAKMKLYSSTQRTLTLRRCSRNSKKTPPKHLASIPINTCKSL